jgi:hypothetical protein
VLRGKQPRLEQANKAGANETSAPEFLIFNDGESFAARVRLAPVPDRVARAAARVSLKTRIDPPGSPRFCLTSCHRGGYGLPAAMGAVS